MKVRAYRLAAFSLGALFASAPAAWADGPATLPHTATPTEPGTLTFQLLPSRFRHSPSGSARSPVVNAAAAQRRYAESMIVDYRDRAALVTRLRELDGLRLLTFWETPGYSVFFGVSRDGIVGLNISQKENRSGQDADDEKTDPEAAPKPTFLATALQRR